MFGDVYGLNMAVDSLSANRQVCVTKVDHLKKEILWAFYRDSSDPPTPATATTPRVPDCYRPPTPGAIWLLTCPYRPPRRPDSPQNTQRRRAGAVGVFYLVLSPRPRPRARGSPSHAHERARRALRGSWVPPLDANAADTSSIESRKITHSKEQLGP